MGLLWHEGGGESGAKKMLRWRGKREEQVESAWGITEGERWGVRNLNGKKVKIGDVERKQ